MNLAGLTQALGAPQDRWLWDVARATRVSDALARGGLAAELAGRNVLLRTVSQLDTALALVALDGFARRIILCPPDFAPEQLADVAGRAEADAALGDATTLPVLADRAPQLRRRTIGAPDGVCVPSPSREMVTEWLMFTSGTTGSPKMVIHTLAGLTDAIRVSNSVPPPVWGTFYDIRRYGGLQILLRALMSGGSLVLSDAHEDVGDFLKRLGGRGVTHLSGTPSHWRQALMRPELNAISPSYVRLSGEIADQVLLDRLQAAFPTAKVAHAYASTEAGVGFEVTDGREGVPAAWIDEGGRGPVAMRLVDGALHLASARAARGYAGGDAAPLMDGDGFVDTGDLMERRGDRLYFSGRRNGVINAGGLKIHPEEVEAVIVGHPGVRIARVAGRRSPIVGALVTAEVVALDPSIDAAARRRLIQEIISTCRERLPAHKRPISVTLRDELPLTAGGKLDRSFA